MQGRHCFRDAIWNCMRWRHSKSYVLVYAENLVLCPGGAAAHVQHPRGGRAVCDVRVQPAASGHGLAGASLRCGAARREYSSFHLNFLFCSRCLHACLPFVPSVSFCGRLKKNRVACRAGGGPDVALNGWEAYETAVFLAQARHSSTAASATSLNSRASRSNLVPVHTFGKAFLTQMLCTSF